MNFHTVVELPTKVPPIRHDHRILMMGSCFTESIGEKLTENKFMTDVNPFGVLYNPLSIAAALREVMAGKVYTKDDLFEYNGLWHSRMHHGSFSAENPEETLRNIQQRLSAATTCLDKLDWIIVTFGTSYVFEQYDDGRIVANCHRRPSTDFSRRRLRIEEIADDFTDLIAEMASRNPDMRWIFTVSPIRHVGDGMHENQLSKSVLLLAIDCLQQLFPDRIIYFPAYEIVLDELRDYRYYTSDMLHPSPLTMDYLWETFCRTFFMEKTRNILTEIEAIRKDLAHRPFHPEGDAYRHFVEQLLRKIDEFEKVHPQLNFEREKEQCRTRLKK